MGTGYKNIISYARNKLYHPYNFWWQDHVNTWVEIDLFRLPEKSWRFWRFDVIVIISDVIILFNVIMLWVELCYVTESKEMCACIQQNRNRRKSVFVFPVKEFNSEAAGL